MSERSSGGLYTLSVLYRNKSSEIKLNHYDKSKKVYLGGLQCYPCFRRSIHNPTFLDQYLKGAPMEPYLTLKEQANDGIWQGFKPRTCVGMEWQYTQKTK
jgi:hypothetical protein